MWWIILYIRYSTLFWIYIKKAWGKTVNLSVNIYINKIEKRTTFKIKTKYYLELLTPETMNSFRSAKSKIIKNRSNENVPYLEINELV